MRLREQGYEKQKKVMNPCVSFRTYCMRQYKEMMYNVPWQLVRL